ncbi:peptidase t [Anaeramoeba flamelloides]|uniref:Peptidase t n=1 Tax=Anaeramoeba flamelloides TaxID=1746091 RepID=A0ABQ8Z1U4_9EUKA|nr:peptidase t [Anaeramoeba flamelloides]
MKRLELLKESTVVDRFIRYAKINTQSCEESKTVPTTERQKDLANLLVKELKELGLKVEMDEFGYVYSVLESNLENEELEIPVIAFLAHMDTSPESSGENVKPLIHKNYQGGKIELPLNNVILDPEESVELKKLIGQSIITSSGDTLLGADDKGGVSSIMDTLNFFVNHPEIKHGEIRIGFTIDEEVGQGTDNLSLEKLGNPKYGYTIDGGSVGEVESENFNADTVKIVFKGFNVHPGYAKNKMVNAIKLAGEFLELLPKTKMSPETTENYEGYVHPYKMTGSPTESEIIFLIRDFDLVELKKSEDLLKELAEKVVNKYKKAQLEFTVIESYRNMKEIIDPLPFLVDFAKIAIEKTGIKPVQVPIRGGTDGSTLSFMGLPCPNLSAGGYNFHSVKEYTSVENLQNIVDMIIELVITWKEEYPKLKKK